MKNSLRNIALFIVILASLVMWLFYRTFFFPNTSANGHPVHFFISEEATFDEVCDSLAAAGIIVNMNSFRNVARLRNYMGNIKPGHYLITDKMTNYRLVNMLRAGLQKPVLVTFNNVRTIYELAGKIGKQTEADSASIAGYLSNESNYKDEGFTKETVIAMFIPDTYELYWNTSPEALFHRMLREYRKFWNEKRLSRAESLKLTPVEISILASIVDDEVAKEEEKPRIAGVYLNRLRIGMPLQACPTIKFALNDFTITRVLTEHTLVDSPYNTYKYRGLPPGPVSCPTISGIDAVLNAEKHDYLFFAARADFSGYHNFSRTLAEHNRYANEYQRELNKRKIFR